MKEIRDRSFRKISRSWFLGCRLFDAMKYGRWEDVEALVKTPELDPNVLVPEYGIAPIHCAAGIEPEDLGLRCVREFLKIGGNPNLKCLDGVTPVHVASCWGRLKVLETLLSMGGDPYLIDNEGKDAFSYAQGRSKISCLLTTFVKSEKQPAYIDGSNIIDATYKTLKLESAQTKCDGDLYLNPVAFSLMVSHRQSVLLYESIPDDDSSSSTTLEQESNENYDFTPLDDRSCVLVGCACPYPPMNDKNAFIESWINNDEIYSENILDTDKTNVIKVINESVNKSLNQTSSHDSIEKSNDKMGHVMSIDLKSDSIVEKNNNILKRSLNHEKNEDVAKEESYVSNCSNREGTKDTLLDVVEVDVPCSDIKPTFFSSICSPDTNTDKNFKAILRSDSDELEFRSPLPSKEMEKVERPSSVDSSSISDSNSKFPKHVKDTLVYFKINTHYRSRTHIFKIISKSNEALRSKKSLYSTGFEYWSTKARSKSYPCYTRPRKNVEQ